MSMFYVFLRCLSDVEHSARTAEIELSLICGDFDDSCPWVMVFAAPRNEFCNPWCFRQQVVYLGPHFASQE